MWKQLIKKVMLYKKYHRSYVRQFKKGRKFYQWGTLIEITDICINDHSIGMICNEIDGYDDEWYSLIECGRLLLNNDHIKWLED